MKVVLTVVGARPQFIKAGPVSHALRGSDKFREVLIHTGQHFDPQMSDVFFDELAIPKPDFTLNIHGLSHGAMTGRMLEKIEEVLLSVQPDVVLIYGDTNSTLAGALAASKMSIPIAHVEAGLRSFNRAMPEEINRVLADHLSTFLFCPTTTAVENLSREGVTSGVSMVGDVMYDATLAAITKAEKSSDILERLSLADRDYSVATIHRQENTDNSDQFERIVTWLKRKSSERMIVFPVHPRTRKVLDRELENRSGIKLVEPLGYLDMVKLVHHSAEVFTDSGGLQKEAYFHRVPCITLRDETEWVETVEAGWNTLWVAKEPPRERRDIPDYGSGNASELIVDNLHKSLN